MGYIAVVHLKAGLTTICSSTIFPISLLPDICWYFHIFKIGCWSSDWPSLEKMPRESVWNKRVEVRVKSEKAEGELESKLSPFYWFFCCCFFVCFVFFVFEKKKKNMMTMHHRLLLWCYWDKEGNINKLPSPPSLCLRRRRRGWRDNASSSSSMLML